MLSSQCRAEQKKIIKLVPRHASNFGSVNFNFLSKKNLREATEVIESWHQQLQDGQPVSKAPSGNGEVILIGRHW